MPRFAVTAAVVVALGASHAAVAYDPSCGTGPGLRPCSFAAPPVYNAPNNYGGGGGYNSGYSAPPRMDPRADRTAAQHRHGVALNDQGVKLANAGNHARAIPLFLEALRYWPESRVFLANLAISRAWVAFDPGNIEQALHYQRQALQYRRNDRVTLGWIAHLESMLANKAGNGELALTKARQAVALNPRNRSSKWLVGQIEKEIDQKAAARMTGSAETQQTASSGATTDRKSTRFFGTGGTPEKPDIDTSPPTKTNPENKSPSAQADAVRKDASKFLDEKNASLEDSSRAGCVYDGRAGCSTGTAVSGIRIEGRRRGVSSLAPQVVAAMKNTPAGKAVIDEELRLAEQLSRADRRVEEIKLKLGSANGAEKGPIEVDLANAKDTRNSIQQGLNKARLDVEDEARHFILLQGKGGK